MNNNIRKFASTLITPFLSITEIMRKDMPQIKSKDVDDVKLLLDKNKIKYVENEIECKDLKKTQENYIPEKLNKMKDNILDGSFKPKEIFISKDDFILDGHHRWLALKELYGDDYKISTIKIDLPKWEALYLFDKASDKLDEILNKKIDKDLVCDFLLSIDLKKILNEVSVADGAEVDDGPPTFYRNINHYKSRVDPIAEQYGFKIMNYLVGERSEYISQRYKFDTVPNVSFYGVGVNPEFKNAEEKYIEFITPLATRLGYEIIDFLMKLENKNE